MTLEAISEEATVDADRHWAGPSPRVSKYQYYEFTAVDRPLTTREQG